MSAATRPATAGVSAPGCCTAPPTSAGWRVRTPSRSRRGGDPELLRPLVGVRPAYLDAARAEVDRRFGSLEGYFADGLGLDPATRAALRALLVKPA